MAKSKIPMRPDNYATPALTQDEQNCLSYYVISGCAKKDAFLAFARPDMLNSRAQAAIDEYVRQFFARKESREYILAYETTLERFLHPQQKLKQFAPDLSMEERKAASKAKLTEFSMSLIQNIEQANDPEMVIKLADKIGLLEVNEEEQEKPRRYLPVQCVAECRYRLFVEENCVDECQYCKYKKSCEEQGIHFEPEHQLDVPVSESEQIKQKDEK